MKDGQLKMKTVTTLSEDITTSHTKKNGKDADIALVQRSRPTKLSDTIRVRKSIDATDKAKLIF